MCGTINNDICLKIPITETMRKEIKEFLAKVFSPAAAFSLPLEPLENMMYQNASCAIDYIDKCLILINGREGFRVPNFLDEESEPEDDIRDGYEIIDGENYEYGSEESYEEYERWLLSE